MDRAAGKVEARLVFEPHPATLTSTEKLGGSDECTPLAHRLPHPALRGFAYADPPFQGNMLPDALDSSSRHAHQVQARRLTWTRTIATWVLLPRLRKITPGRRVITIEASPSSRSVRKPHRELGRVDRVPSIPSTPNPALCGLSCAARQSRGALLGGGIQIVMLTSSSERAQLELGPFHNQGARALVVKVHTWRGGNFPCLLEAFLRCNHTERLGRANRVPSIPSTPNPALRGLSCKVPPVQWSALPDA